MRLGVVIYSGDPEVVWNAFRLANYALKEKDNVKVFLLAKGVECESLPSEPFDIPAEMKKFVAACGAILACGTCLEIRNSDGTELCPLSTMSDLHEIVKTSDKVITF